MHAEQQLHVLTAVKRSQTTKADEGSVVGVIFKLDVHGEKPNAMLDEATFAGGDHIFDLLQRNNQPFKKIASHLWVYAEFMHYCNMTQLQWCEM